MNKDGYIKNNTKIPGLVDINISLNEPTEYKVRYGYEKYTYDFDSKTYSIKDKKYDFNMDHPNYFSLSFLEDASIKSITISFINVELPNPFVKVPNLPDVTPTEHTYNVKETVSFPSFNVTDGLSYHLSDDGTYYIVDNYNDTMVLENNVNRIVFPKEYNGLPVREIGNKGFLERWWIFEIFIPETIEKIALECFSMCGLTKIYWDAISCNDFPARNAIFNPGDSHDHQNIDLIFGPHVKRVPARMMLPSMMTPNVHPKVNSISFASGCQIEEIGDYAFYGLSNLNRIDLPESVKSIGEYAFYGWDLEEFSLDNVISISNSAFRFNKNLKHVHLPSSLSYLGEQVFEGCDLIEEIDLSNTSIELIKFSTFKNCLSLKHILFPNNLLTIEESAFEGCSALTEFYAPSALLSIGNKSFYHCESLICIKLNESLKDIGDEAFRYVTSVSTLIIDCNHLNDLDLNNKAFVNFGVKELKVYITENVEYIPSNTFYGSSFIDYLPTISALYIYSNLEGVGDNAFFGQTSTHIEYYGGYKDDIASWNIGINNDVFSDIKGRE